MTSCKTSGKHNNKKHRKRDTRTRRQKEMRKLYKAAKSPNQKRIPNYFRILNNIECIINENNELKKTISNLFQYSYKNPEMRQNQGQIASHQNISLNANNLPRDSPTSILKLILKSAQMNTRKLKAGHRYGETVMVFAAYIKMLAGRLAYETLYVNLPNALPSPSAVNRFINRKGTCIVEGELRIDELKTFLYTHGCELAIWISEDATSITGKIQYDSGISFYNLYIR